ncbi:Ribonuclease H-like protein [Apiospora arundinis]
MDAFVQRSSRRKPSAASQNSECFGESSRAIDSHVTDFNDSISVPNYFTSSPPRFSSPSVSVDTALEPLTDIPPFPDYTVWTPAIFSHLPGLLLCHDTTKELAWWWSPPIHTNHYVFVASTSKSIERHLAAKHHIRAPRSSRHAADARGRSLASFLPVDRHNPFEQALLGRVNNMYSSRRTTLLLLNWLLRENLPFHTVDTPAFEQVIKSLNPIASIPNSKSFLRLLVTLLAWRLWGPTSILIRLSVGSHVPPHTINLVTKAMMYGTKRDNFAELLRTVGSIHPDTDITEGGRDMVAADVQALNEALDEVIFYEEPP